MPPTLEHYFTMRAYFDRENMLPVGKIKGGPERTVVPLHTGWLRGRDTTAKLLPGSGDWFLVSSSSAGLANVPTQSLTLVSSAQS
jgi:hypothetical protein